MKERQDMDREAAVLAERLRPALLKLSRHLRREAQRVGISDLDAQIMGLIRRRPGMGISELAAIEQMSRPAMSAHVKRLEEAGWVARRTDIPADRRRVRLALTAAGTAALDAIRRSRNDWLEMRLSHLSPEEIEALQKALAPFLKLAETKP